MWAFGCAVRKGSMHGDGEICQDFAGCDVVSLDGETVAIAAVSDGAGSAEFGGVGAEVAAKAFVDEVRSRIEQRESVSRLMMEAAFRSAIAAVLSASEQAEQPAQSYSCTLVTAILTSKESFFGQIGDGASVFRLGKEYAVAIWPRESEFVNSSEFLTTENAADLVQVRRIAGEVSEAVLFSDGLQYLVLDTKEKAPHQRFFVTVSEQLGDQLSGRSVFIDSWLAALLDAPQVTTRTDDDTSIVVVRRSVEATVAG